MGLSTAIRITIESLFAIFASSALHLSRCSSSLMILMTAGVALLSGCTSDPVTNSSVSVSSDGQAATKDAEEPPKSTKPTASSGSSDPISVPEPSPHEPVTATMVLQPATLTPGSDAILIVSVRIARAHFVHAPNIKPGEPWIPLEMKMSLPDGIEFAGDWQFPPGEKGSGDSPVYRDSVLLRRALRVRAIPPSSVASLSGELRYQACNDELCWPPRTIKLSAPFSIRVQAR